MKQMVILFLLCLCAGCDSNPPPVNMVDDSPISVEAWQELTTAEKYAPETLERLRQHDSKLNTEDNWHRFMRDIVVPQRRQDIPTNY